jgi:hypothetical protein
MLLFNSEAIDILFFSNYKTVEIGEAIRTSISIRQVLFLISRGGTEYP